MQAYGNLLFENGASYLPNQFAMIPAPNAVLSDGTGPTSGARPEWAIILLLAFTIIGAVIGIQVGTHLLLKMASNHLCTGLFHVWPVSEGCCTSSSPAQDLLRFCMRSHHLDICHAMLDEPPSVRHMRTMLYVPLDCRLLMKVLEENMLLRLHYFHLTTRKTI